MSSSDHIPLLSGTEPQRTLSSAANRELLTRDVLPGFIRRCRWFGGKAREAQKFEVRDIVPLDPAPESAQLVLVDVHYLDGPADTYLLPLQVARHREAETLLAAGPMAVAARLEGSAVIGDALYLNGFRTELYRLMAGGASLSGQHGHIHGIPGPLLAGQPTPPASRALSVEQSNSSIVYGERVFLKLYRRLEEGVNPDAEILRFLGDRKFPHVPPFAGSIEYRASTGGARVLALALGMVPNDGDAWAFTLRHLADYYGKVQHGSAEAASQAASQYFAAVAQLGTRTGELHCTLASDTEHPDFSPEPISRDDTHATAEALRLAIQQVDRLLLERFEVLDVATRQLAEQLRAQVSTLRAGADSLAHLATAAKKTRTHGDYHLGQVLHGPSGFVIIDFEGEPLRSLAERRKKMSPFRDVAGMLRSFHYAAYAALEPLPETSRAKLVATAERWAARAQQTFLEAWQSATTGAVFRDPDAATEQALLQGFLLEKALYEVRYEVNNRPTWLGIPLRGVLGLVKTQDA